MIWDDIAIYRNIPCHVTPDPLETTCKYKFNETPPPRCGTLDIFGVVSARTLACPPSGLFRRPSVVHQLDTSQGRSHYYGTALCKTGNYPNRG